MNIRILYVLFLASMPMAEAKHRAGADISGGGKGVVCRDPAGHLLSVEMLDLYEARNLYALNPLAMGSNLDQVIAVAKEKFSHTVFDGAWTIPPELDRLRSQLRILPAGQKLVPVNDAAPIIHNPGCSLEQAAVWVNPSLVVADRELWEAMDARNQGALLAHEVIYSSTRAEGERDSRRARKIVGHIFSQFDFTGVRDGLPANPRTLCVSGAPRGSYSEFWIYPNEKGQLVVQLDILHKSWLYGKTTAAFTIPYVASGPSDTSVVELQDLVSGFETGRTFMLGARWNERGERELSARETDEKGELVTVPVHCTDQP
jgi:hypothetical protein